MFKTNEEARAYIEELTRAGEEMDKAVAADPRASRWTYAPWCKPGETYSRAPIRWLDVQIIEIDGTRRTVEMLTYLQERAERVSAETAR